MLLLCVLSACLDERRVMVPATVVRVQAQAPYVDDMCGYMLSFIRPETSHVDDYTALHSSEIAALVQVQYLLPPDAQASSEPPHIDFTLAHGEHADVPASATDETLYRVDERGELADVSELLRSETTDMLVFSYPVNVTTPLHRELFSETHVVESPRPIGVDRKDPGVCCSTGRPCELALIAVTLLFTGRSRRRRL